MGWTKERTLFVTHLVLWQGSWFAIVLGAAQGWWWSGPLFAAPVLITAGLALRSTLPQWWQPVVAATVLGIVVDGLLYAQGAFVPQAAISGGFNLWMPCLWACLASALPLCLNWLVRLPWAWSIPVAVIAGGASGTFAYLGGFYYKALLPGSLDRTSYVILIAAAWATALPALVIGYRRWLQLIRPEKSGTTP